MEGATGAAALTEDSVGYRQVWKPALQHMAERRGEGLMEGVDRGETYRGLVRILW
jgi:hypothetical protein